MAEESAIIKTVYDGTIAFVDNTPTTYTVPCTVSMDVSGLQNAQREAVPYTCRGTLKSLRLGKRVFPSGSIEMYMTGLSDAAKTTVMDLIMKSAYYSASPSTTVAIGDVRTLDVILTIEGTDLGDSSDHVLTLEDCHISVGLKEGEPNTLSGSFTCYGTVSRT